MPDGGGVVFASRLLPSSGELRCHSIPTRCLTQTLAWRHRTGGRKLRLRHRAIERRNAEHRTATQRQQELGEALQSGRLNPTLDPADRVLAGPRAQRESALAEPLLLARFAENLASL